MPRLALTLIEDEFPERPALDTAALPRAILERVAAGEMGPTLRIHRPGAIVAFSKQDRNASGLGAAVRSAGDGGFAAVERLAGGRAAVFHPGTAAIMWTVPEDKPRETIGARFETAAEIVRAALASLGVDARVGEVPGEYCPGGFSVNAGGRRKLAGLGQRVVTGAAHTGGVVVATGSGTIRDVLVPVYSALDLDWDPETAGAAEDEAPGVTYEDVASSLVEAFSQRYELTPSALDPATLGLAEAYEAAHDLTRAAVA